MKNKEFIIILSETGEVFVSEYDSQLFERPSDFLIYLNEEHNLNLTENNCNYHITKDKLTIKYL